MSREDNLGYNLRETQLLPLGKNSYRQNYVLGRSCLESSSSERALAAGADTKPGSRLEYEAVPSARLPGACRERRQEGAPPWALAGTAEANGQRPRKRTGWLVKGRRPVCGLEEPNTWSGCQKRE